MTAPGEGPHLNALETELGVVGELEGDRGRHLAACSECQERVKALLEASSAFLEAQSFEDFAQGPINEALETATPRFSRRLAVGAGLLASAAALWVALLPKPPDSEIRLKGPGGFSAIRARDGRQSEHLGEVEIRPGDRLRFSVWLSAPATLRLELREGGAPPVQLFDGGRMAAGQHFVPKVALRAESPLRVGSVRLYLDGELEDELLIRVEDDAR